MKKFSSFIAGVLTTAIVGSISISALAASGAMTISVDPINIQVNGETFAPKDVNGKSVPVFAYNGTTYAPLRALAEAYGLEVGYDANSNMATVNNPTTTNSSFYQDVEEVSFGYIKINGEKYQWRSIGGNYPVKAAISKINGENEIFMQMQTYDYGDGVQCLITDLASIIFFSLDNNISFFEPIPNTGIPVIKNPITSKDLKPYIICGVNGTQSVPYTTSTNVWIEYNGNRVYSTSEGSGIKNGIHYNGRWMCVNDILDQFNIPTTLSVEMSEDGYCLVILGDN